MWDNIHSSTPENVDVAMPRNIHSPIPENADIPIPENNHISQTQFQKVNIDNWYIKKQWFLDIWLGW